VTIGDSPVGGLIYVEGVDDEELGKRAEAMAAEMAGS